MAIAYRLSFSNGKAYIGITRETLQRRVNRHIAYARAGKHYALSAAIRKHGEDSFTANEIGSGTWNEVQLIEISTIAAHRLAGEKVYNMTAGGEGSLGAPVTLVTRLKISAALSGRKLSDAHRFRIGESQRGKIIPPETRKKMSDAARLTRKPMSEDQKQKIRLALVGKSQTPERVAKRVSVRVAKGSY